MMILISFYWLRYRRLLLLLTAVSILASCQSSEIKTHSSGKSSSFAQTNPLSDRTRSELYQAILAAELALGKQQSEAALTHYLYALNLLPDAKIAEESILLAQQLNDASALIQASDLWLGISPKNFRALQANILGYLIQFDRSEFLRQESLEAAYRSAVKIIKASSDNTQAFRELSGVTRIYLHNSTLTLWQELVRQQSSNPLTWALLADANIKIAGYTKNDQFLQHAEHAISAALRQDSTYAPAIDLKMQWFRATHQESQIVPFLELLLVENQDNPAAYASLAQEYYRTRNHAKTLAIIHRWQKFEPDNLEARYLLAASYYGTQKFQLALDEFRFLATQNYNPEVTFYYCGDTAERIGQIAQAIGCYQLVGSGKYWYSAQKRLSALLIEQGREKEVLAKLEKIALNGVSSQTEEAAELRAEALINLNRHAEATIWLSRFINTDLQSVAIPITLMQAQYHLSPDIDWIEFSDNIAIRLNDSLVDLWYQQVAGQLANQAKANQAIMLLNHAIQKHPDSIELLYSRALMQDKVNRPDLLEQELRHVYSLAPENPHIQNALGYTLADLNKELEFARELVFKAQKQMPGNAAIIDSLGWVFFRLGESEKAEALLRSALEREPSPEVAAHLIEVLTNNNKKEEAEKLLQHWWPKHQNNRHLRQVKEKLNLQELP